MESYAKYVRLKRLTAVVLKNECQLRRSLSNLSKILKIERLCFVNFQEDYYPTSHRNYSAIRSLRICALTAVKQPLDELLKEIKNA